MQDNELARKLELERQYWGYCTNTFMEEKKQYTYARFMGLKEDYYFFKNIVGKNILDIGGGPSSMLLKTWGFNRGRVVDPIKWPDWIRARYAIINVDLVESGGEDINERGWDEVWIYNCLQHVVDPKKIIENAKRAAPVLRIFEWIDIPPHEGHPHMLTRHDLEQWIGQTGQVAEAKDMPEMDEPGRCFYGVFTF